eukprot:974167-Amphidinium_carterae.1
MASMPNLAVKVTNNSDLNQTEVPCWFDPNSQKSNVRQMCPLIWERNCTLMLWSFVGACRGVGGELYP